jgi:membrane-associated protein
MRELADLLARHPYTGLFLLLLAEEAGVPLPVPGDVFIAGIGVAARAGHASFVPAALVVTAATVVGSIFLYSLSRHGGRPLLLRLGRRLGWGEERGARVEAWLARRGAVAVVVGRLTPGLRIIMTVVAGVLGLDRKVFVTGTTVAALLWASIYFWLGYTLGAGYERLARVTPLWVLVGLGVVVVAAALLVVRWARRHGASSAKAGRWS